MRSRSEDIRQSNSNAYINCSADLYVSSLLALLTNTYTSVYSCVLFILTSISFNNFVFCHLLLTSVADLYPGSGAILTHGSGIRDLGWVKSQDPDPG